MRFLETGGCIDKIRYNVDNNDKIGDLFSLNERDRFF